MKILYVPKKFNPVHQKIIDQANQIITGYSAQGYDLTLRQLYYQFVSKEWFPDEWRDPKTNSTNNNKSYDKLGGIISDARRAGLVDWHAIVDRTRNVRKPPTWGGPPDIIAACASQFSIDCWADQEYRPEVWVEKDALVGVLEVACEPWHCPYFSCRGYTSDSEAWAAAQRLKKASDNGQIPVVFHLGDHDPSGIDMSRDIQDRIDLFSGLTGAKRVQVRRIALNMNQVEEVNPPANPAKTTDGRFAKYQELYGDDSWELDALDPTYITTLISDEMKKLVDEQAWEDATHRRDNGRRLLQAVSDDWDRLTEGM